MFSLAAGRLAQDYRARDIRNLDERDNILRLSDPWLLSMSRSFIESIAFAYAFSSWMKPSAHHFLSTMQLYSTVSIDIETT